VHRTDRYPLHWPRDPEHWLTPSTLLAALVAEIDGRIAGHVALCSAHGEPAASQWSSAAGLPEERLAVVARFFVSPDTRGLRLGAGLLEAAVAEARSRGLLPVLEVLRHNRPAIALYRSMGWRHIGSRTAGWARQSGVSPILEYFIAEDEGHTGSDRGSVSLR
jgi:GNAT superfamily N-acetyltransferase